MTKNIVLFFRRHRWRAPRTTD